MVTAAAALSDMTIGSSARAEIEKFRRSCAEENKDPLALCLAAYRAHKTCTDALADIGLTKEAERLIHYEVRWRCTYAVLADPLAEMPAEMEDV